VEVTLAWLYGLNEADKSTYGILFGKTVLNQPLGRIRKYEDDIKIDLKECRIGGG
jgi:hypothetical protein